VPLRRCALFLLLMVLAAPALRAEYVVLRSGQRLKVTGYQLLGDKYHLQLSGGFVDVAAADVVTIEPEDVFTPVPPTVAPQPLYRDLVEAAAKRYNMDADLITSVIAVESNFDPKAVSRKNARGLMQLLPETAAQLGVKNIDDPAENIDAGTRYLRDLLQKYNNDLALALAAYNAGPDKVQLYGRVPPFAETVSYVRRVKTGYATSKSKASTKTPAAPGAPVAKAVATPAPSGAVAATSPPHASQPQ
jgi:soluble lytic murein transglycosylase-like protein